MTAALAAAAPAAAAEPFDALVFTKTAGWRHDSIPAGVDAIRALGERHGFRVRATEDAAVFTHARLRRFEVVVFLNTTGTVLDGPQRRALRAHLRRGGGFAGIHSAADTEDGWPFYGRLVGARFLSHPAPQTATFVNEARRAPATRLLPARFGVHDELYSFRSNPRARVRVLLSVDESTYAPAPTATSGPEGTGPVTGVMGDHPMSWCHDLRGRGGRAGGRVFYTALGHEAALYERRWFRRHLLGGIRMAARAATADCDPR